MTVAEWREGTYSKSYWADMTCPSVRSKQLLRTYQDSSGKALVYIERTKASGAREWILDLSSAGRVHSSEPWQYSTDGGVDSGVDSTRTIQRRGSRRLTPPVRILGSKPQRQVGGFSVKTAERAVDSSGGRKQTKSGGGVRSGVCRRRITASSWFLGSR
jgi:hypothetical protein